MPGSRGYLRVEIDDITRNQVLLTVRGGDGTEIVPRRSVAVRDRIELPLSSGSCTITVEQLENLLIGDDFAELRVQQTSQLAPDRISALLVLIEKSDAKFVRDGREFDGARAAVHVRTKLAWLGREPTLAEFTDDVASRSSETGKPYVVRLRDGSEQAMDEWLRARLREIEAPPAKDRR